MGRISNRAPQHEPKKVASRPGKRLEGRADVSRTRELMTLGATGELIWNMMVRGLRAERVIKGTRSWVRQQRPDGQWHDYDTWPELQQLLDAKVLSVFADPRCHPTPSYPVVVAPIGASEGYNRRRDGWPLGVLFPADTDANDLTVTHPTLVVLDVCTAKNSDDNGLSSVITTIDGAYLGALFRWLATATAAYDHRRPAGIVHAFAAINNYTNNYVGFTRTTATVHVEVRFQTIARRICPTTSLVRYRAVTPVGGQSPPVSLPLAAALAAPGALLDLAAIGALVP